MPPGEQDAETTCVLCIDIITKKMQCYSAVPVASCSKRAIREKGKQKYSAANTSGSRSRLVSGAAYACWSSGWGAAL